MKKLFIFILFLGVHAHLTAQLSADGIRFSHCEGRNLPHDFYKNNFVVLDFWATWCGPCIGSFPKLNDLAEKYKAKKNIVFASITAEPRGKVDTFFSKKKDILPGFLHLVDDSGTTWKYFNIERIPLIFVFSPSGQLVFKGTVEKLATCFDTLLLGGSIAAADHPPIADEKWEDYKKNAVYIALTGAPQRSAKRSQSMMQGEKVVFDFEGYSLSDILNSVDKVSNARITTNDTAKLNRLIDLYYKQIKNNFPEYDKGLFANQYQNHILQILEKNYGFHCEWTTCKTTGYKIVVKDADMLKASKTISTKGSYSSRLDTKGKRYLFVNQKPDAFASCAEDEFGMIVFAGNFADGYDVALDFLTMNAFTKSLEKYGLTLEEVKDYEVKKLNVIFD